MPYAKIIKNARLERKLSQEELARRIGVTKGAVSQWESGESAPSRKNQRALAKELGISSKELEAALSSGLSLLDSLPAGREIPLVAWSELGRWAGKRDTKSRAVGHVGYLGGVVTVEGDSPADAVAAAVEDDSMEPEFHPGDIIIFSATVTPRKDDVVVATTDDGPVLRHYSPRGKNKAGEDVFDLLSTSPDYETLSSSSAKLIGVVIEHRRKRR